MFTIVKYFGISLLLGHYSTKSLNAYTFQLFREIKLSSAVVFWTSKCLVDTKIN
jgi:hypothetical protein